MSSMDANIPEYGEKVIGEITYESYPAPVTWEAHQAFEISVMLCGYMTRYSEGLALELGPGDVALSSAWEPHGWQTTAPGTVGITVFFVPELLGDELFEEISWLDLFVAAPRDRPRVQAGETRREVLMIVAELKQEIEARFRACPDESQRWLSGPLSGRAKQDKGSFESKETYARKRWLTAMRLGIVRLLFALARAWEIPGPVRGQSSVHPSTLARIAPALNLIQSRAGHPVHLSEGAAACHLGVTRFSEVFRRTMGVSFGKHVLRSRLGRGAELLLASDAPVEVIAQSLGFTDASHFHRAFVKLHGCTPDRHRGIHFHRKTQTRRPWA